ncbi:hypothetical protein AB0K00_37360 [Dactylosporangium sp. NPDC049525]|uniref:hypothetical protein n=1 Tax=Dactylosporangium sp. NPDC049525 TaxID=3154730 RepID=UPI00342293AB
MIVRDWESEALILDWKLLVGGPGGVLAGVLFRSVGWASIEAIMFEPRPDGHPRLVLVPAAGADLGVPAEYRNGVDGRPSVILVNIADVRESPDQVRAALQRYAGDRYAHAD